MLFISRYWHAFRFPTTILCAENFIIIRQRSTNDILIAKLLRRRCLAAIAYPHLISAGIQIDRQAGREETDCILCKTTEQRRCTNLNFKCDAETIGLIKQSSRCVASVASCRSQLAAHICHNINIDQSRPLDVDAMESSIKWT